MKRFGVLATAGAAVAIGLAPAVPLFLADTPAGLPSLLPRFLAHDRPAFVVPDVHFYAVSATALVCAAARRGAQQSPAYAATTAAPSPSARASP